MVAVLAADTNFHELLTRTAPQLPNAQDMFTDDDAQFPRNPRLEFEEAVSIR